MNIKKYGIIVGRIASFDEAIDPIYVSRKVLLIVKVYNYLSFPIESRGIDFHEYLTKRLSQANGRASFLRLYSDS